MIWYLPNIFFRTENPFYLATIAELSISLLGGGRLVNCLHFRFQLFCFVLWFGENVLTFSNLCSRTYSVFQNVNHSLVSYSNPSFVNFSQSQRLSFSSVTCYPANRSCNLIRFESDDFLRIQLLEFTFRTTKIQFNTIG